MSRSFEVERNTKETQVKVKLVIDGQGKTDISTGIPFFDHMLTLFAVHGFFDLSVSASGDLEVDYHHTVEDIGLVLGTAICKALGDRKGIVRYGHSVVPMDDARADITVDLSNRPYLVYHLPDVKSHGGFDISLAKEFFRSLAVQGGMNLHINVDYGENDHHIIEAVFKALGRALDSATQIDSRITGVRSSKGTL